MKQLFNNIVGKVASALAFKENQDACVRKPFIQFDENLDPNRAYDISVQSRLLQKMVEEKDHSQKLVAGYQLREEFEHSLKLKNDDHHFLLKDKVNLEDIDHDTACEMVFTALEVTGKAAEKFANLYKLRNAMHLAVEEYLTPDRLSREETSQMLQDLVVSHKVDEHRNNLLASKKQLINGIYYS